MSITDEGMFTEKPRKLGEISAHHPAQNVRTLAAEEAIGFGQAVMPGTTGADGKKFAGAGKEFLGVAASSIEAANLNSEAYAALDPMGVVDSGFVQVAVDEDVNDGDPVRITIATRAGHTIGNFGTAADAAKATLLTGAEFRSDATVTHGEQVISSLGLRFVGATVPAIASATYDLDVTIDGGSLNQLAVALLVGDDWDGVAAKIQTALRTATSRLETVVIEDGQLKIASATYGPISTVLVAAGTAGSGGGDLLAYIDASVANMTMNIEDAVVGTGIATVFLSPDFSATDDT